MKTLANFLLVVIIYEFVALINGGLIFILIWIFGNPVVIGRYLYVMSIAAKVTGGTIGLFILAALFDIANDKERKRKQ